MVKQKRTGGAWYYEFMLQGKRYYGTCEGANSRRAAEAIEKTVREKAVQAAGLKSVKALYETFREDLTGGKKIRLDDAFTLAEQKPRARRPGEGYAGMKRGVWLDFLSFMHDKHPEAVNLADVTEAHAQDYISLLQQSGRYNKTVNYSRGEGKKARSISRQTGSALSARTIRLHQTVCAEVFTLLAKDAGILDNPFAGIRKMKSDAKTREAFTPAELKKIFDNLDGFTRPLFTLAVWTGLREGDICTLKWSDIDLAARLITRETRKTGAVVHIPISNPLYDLLDATPRTDSEYVFPEHAAMYLDNPSGVSYRVKSYLENLGIQTTRTPDGRARAVSVKDLHSCRHTFCYYAGLAGIPLSVVQAVVGHMTPGMTAHYSAHASIEDARRGMKKLSFAPELPPPNDEPERTELRRLADTLPINEIRAIIGAAKAGKFKAGARV